MSGAPPPQPPEQAERDDEVGVVVVEGGEQAERVVAGQPAVEGALGVEVERLLEVKDRARMASATLRRSGARLLIMS